MAMLTGKGMVEYAKGKVGTPYFFGAKMEILTNALMANMHRLYPGTVTDRYMEKAKSMGNVGKINTDCSGLIGGYRNKQIGSAQLYQTASARLSVKEADKWADGVVCWRSGHVGVFSRENGKKYVYEAKGIDYGTIKSVFDPAKWSAGLTFSDIAYIYEETVSDKSSHGPNPFPEPTVNLKLGANDQMVKWVQFELNEAGYQIDIDGDFGPLTDTAVRSFQRSCKIEVDGIVGKITRQYLKADVPEDVSTTQTGYTFGVDVSKYQGVIDWTKVFRAGMRFAVLKVTQRDNTVEPSFERNYAGCRANGLAVAVYRYVYATTKQAAETEANAIIKTLEGKKLDGEVWLDMEDRSIAGIGKTALTAIIDTEAAILKEAGYKVGIYCNRDWYEHTLDSAELSKRFPFWIAKYGNNDGSWENRTDNPKDIAVAWQFTSKGHVSGIKGGVDVNLLY